MVRTHTVVAGETLSALALRFYGDAELSWLIASASGIADPNVINVGQRLIMPDFTRYTVVAGDTPSALALRFYGDAELSWLIASASGIADPNVINVGQQLIIPDLTRHTVVAGDTLSALAVRFYGDAALYPLIATVNGIADPNVINVGQVLVIFAPGLAVRAAVAVVTGGTSHPRSPATVGVRINRQHHYRSAGAGGHPRRPGRGRSAGVGRPVPNTTVRTPQVRSPTRRPDPTGHRSPARRQLAGTPHRRSDRMTSPTHLPCRQMSLGCWGPSIPWHL